MPITPRSHGLWDATAPPAPALAPLSGAVRADVAVVGAGYAGLSAALRLAEAGARVVVLEAAEVGFGGAGRNVGLVNAGLWVMPDAILSALGPARGEALIAFLGAAPQAVFDLVARHAIPCEAAPVGTLHCAVGTAGRAEIEARAAQWQARGAPVRLLDAGEARAMVGGGAFSGALLDLRAGTLQPLAYARGLARAALAAGAQIFISSPVTAAGETAAGWRLATPAGHVEADHLIAATDAYGTGPFAPLRREQVHLPYFNLATAPLPEEVRGTILPGRQGAWDTQPILTSFRLDAAGRLVFGSVGALDRVGGAIHRAYVRRALARLYPQLGQMASEVASEVAFEAGWHGMIGMTADALPRFHRLGRTGVAVAGYNGRGIGPGTVFGALLADLVLGRVREADVPLPPSAVQPARWRPAREAVYAAGSGLAHLVAARF
ncbi:FAD-binding oxidoreductase [Xanthobacter autotrophicus]|uniref:NAD(P)/FAD-dependent oxidoreductase n=1 Tax=Xanthobacter TaxID=279 RepID=UPI0024AB2E85|nr:FAD-binding oxidoreductase [Xanthobacter autotrophicus]MDI4664801.1 FAD-binding oxidoreductase [Xanthobacter autotrophicus]